MHMTIISAMHKAASEKGAGQTYPDPKAWTANLIQYVREHGDMANVSETDPRFLAFAALLLMRDVPSNAHKESDDKTVVARLRLVDHLDRLPVYTTAMDVLCDMDQTNTLVADTRIALEWLKNYLDHAMPAAHSDDPIARLVTSLDRAWLGSKEGVEAHEKKLKDLYAEAGYGNNAFLTDRLEFLQVLVDQFKSDGGYPERLKHAEGLLDKYTLMRYAKKRITHD